MSEKYNCVVRIRVEKNDGESRHAFGHGIASLMSGVQEYHSLNKAAKKMGMSYSKAWTSIKEAEEELGFSLVNRDGQRGSTLTDKGKHFLEMFKLAEAAAQATSNSILKNFDI